MINDIDKQTRSNKIFKIIKDFEQLFPDEFNKCGIKRCGHCNATGIGDKASMSLCTNCGGMAYVGFEKIGDDFICRGCNGYGCPKCNQVGLVDWCTHARGNDLSPYAKPYNYRHLNQCERLINEQHK